MHKKTDSLRKYDNDELIIIDRDDDDEKKDTWRLARFILSHLFSERTPCETGLASLMQTALEWI